MTDEEITEILWKKDTKEIFDWRKVNFIEGAEQFLLWCATYNHKIKIITANPIKGYVHGFIVAKLSYFLKNYIGNEIYFTWEKHLLDTDIIIDDDERFIQRCEKINKKAILLRKSHYAYERKYKLEANNFEEVKEIINGLIK